MSEVSTCNSQEFLESGNLLLPIGRGAVPMRTAARPERLQQRARSAQAITQLGAGVRANCGRAARYDNRAGSGDIRFLLPVRDSIGRLDGRELGLPGADDDRLGSLGRRSASDMPLVKLPGSVISSPRRINNRERPCQATGCVRSSCFNKSMNTGLIASDRQLTAWVGGWAKNHVTTGCFGNRG